MKIMGDKIMTAQQVIDTCFDVPKREDIIKNDTARTNYWKPLPHREPVLAHMEAFDHYGIEVIDSSFALNKTGHLLVGGYTLKGGILPEMPGKLDANWQMFWRGANDMSVSNQANGGADLLVCTNGMMTGDCLAKRKHTTGFDIRTWARENLIPSFIEYCNGFGGVVQAMKEFEISERDGEHLLVQLGRMGVMPKARVFDAIEEWYNPVYNEDDFPRETAWKLYHDCTHVAQKCQADRQHKIVKESFEVICPNLAEQVA